MFISKIISKKKDFLAAKNTDIVIEGYPRSGNSFAFTAFDMVQKTNLKIAHHFHLPFQIIYASKHNIPCIVLIREPIDAVVSYLIFSRYLSVKSALKYYIFFYANIYPYKEKFVSAFFKDVVRDYSEIVEKVNKKYNSDFVVFDHTQEAVSKCFKEIEGTEKRVRSKNKSMDKTIPVPSVPRDKLKPEIRKELKKDKYMFLLKKANKIYNSYAEG